MILPNRTFVSDWIFDKRLRRLNAQVQLLLIFLRPLCDVAGRFEWDAMRIHAALYRSAECGNVSVRDVEGWLELLRSVGCIKSYVGPDGRRIGEVIKEYWQQRLNYGSAKYAAEPDSPELDLGGAPPPHPQKRSEVKRISRERPADAGRDECFLALARVDGSDPAQMTPLAKRTVATMLKQIRAAMSDVTPEEIARRASAYRRRFPGSALTPGALAKHWGALGGSTVAALASAHPWDEEPEGWRAYWRDTYPPEEFPNATRWEDGEWGEIPAMTRKDIFYGVRSGSLVKTA
jgi:hypothetical protein